MSEDFEGDEDSVGVDLFAEPASTAFFVDGIDDPLPEGGEPVTVDLVDDSKGHVDAITDEAVLENVDDRIEELREQAECALNFENKVKQLRALADKEAFFILDGMKKADRGHELSGEVQGLLDESESDFLVERDLSRSHHSRRFEERGGHYFADQLGEPVKLRYRHGDHLKDPREVLLNEVFVNGFGERSIKGFTLSSDKLKMESKGRVFRHCSEPAVKAKRFF